MDTKKWKVLWKDMDQVVVEDTQEVGLMVEEVIQVDLVTEEDMVEDIMEVVMEVIGMIGFRIIIHIIGDTLATIHLIYSLFIYNSL
jgi:hypothetical protein